MWKLFVDFGIAEVVFNRLGRFVVLRFRRVPSSKSKQEASAANAFYVKVLPSGVHLVYMAMAHFGSPTLGCHNLKRWLAT